MTLANKITILRIILVPIFIIALLSRLWWSVLIYIPIILSDCIDGYIARVKKQQTFLGAFLDPLADRLLLIFTFLTLSYQNIVPRWIFVVVLTRDLIVVLGWFLIFLLTANKEIIPRTTGKVAIISQMLFVLLILLNPDALTSKDINLERIVLYIIAFLTIASAIDYMIVGINRLRRLCLRS